jgi:protein-S-isoprenylcysteine O-methyltransferase Ste14
MKNKFRFTPPDYILVFIILEILLNYIFPLKQIIFAPYIYLGILLIIIGAYLNFIWVYFTFKKEKTTFNPYVSPTKLITYGAFKISRNPTYLGMSLILFGTAIFLGSLSPFIFPILFIILTNRFIIPIEESNLQKKFGKKYSSYKTSTRRWI